MSRIQQCSCLTVVLISITVVQLGKETLQVNVVNAICSCIQFVPVSHTETVSHIRVCILQCVRPSFLKGPSKDAAFKQRTHIHLPSN